MKKILSIAMLLMLVLSMAVVPASAAERTNVLTLDTAEFWLEFGIKGGSSKHVIEYMFDGVKHYDGNDASTYCDNQVADGKTAYLNESCMKYDIDGDPGAMEVPYYAGVQLKLDKVYTIDGVRMYFGDTIEGIINTINIDGIDILVSKTGEPGSWTKVYSETELTCGKKYKVETSIVNDVEFNTCYIEADFAPMDAQYIAYGLTDSRCTHLEKIVASGIFEAKGKEVPTDRASLVDAVRPDYWRISEIEVYGTVSANQP